MAIFLDPQALVLFDIPLFLLFFGIVFLFLRLIMGKPDPVSNTAMAALAGGAAFIIVRSQFEIQRWIWFNPQLFWGMVILVYILIIIYMMLRV